MSVIINASSASGLVMTSDLSGTLSLQSNGVAVTVPAVAGTMMVSGNMPAFSAYLSANQSVTTGVQTKVLFDVEVFDTNNNFASSRFTPTVAGYYQINGMIRCNSGSTNSIGSASIYKNGSAYATATLSITSISTNPSIISDIVYLNGSTDYVEIYGLVTSATTPIFEGGSTFTRFSGCLIRAA